MEWDSVLHKPISANETLCQDIENITFSWELSDLSSPTSTSHPLVNFDNLMVSSLENPSPAQPLLSTAIPTSASAPAARDCSSVNTTSSTHLLVQQLQAQVLAMSGAPLLWTTSQWAPLCPPKTSSATCNHRSILFLLLELSSPQ